MSILANYNKIIVLLGAGISTNAGIPDFRGPEGLYRTNEGSEAELENMLTLSYFKEHPEFLIDFNNIFFSKTYEPTFSHMALSQLCKAGKITRIYTQNIDGLEEKAGIPEDKIIYCHGNLKTAKCCECGKQYDIEMAKSINKCENHIKVSRKHNKGRGEIEIICHNYIQPNIVLYGQNLSDKYYDSVKKDFTRQNCDCILIVGTSLKVFPVALLKDKLKKVPHIYVNKYYEPDVEYYREVQNSYYSHPKTKTKMRIITMDCDEFFKKELDLIENKGAESETKEFETKKIENKESDEVKNTN